MFQIQYKNKEKLSAVIRHLDIYSERCCRLERQHFLFIITNCSEKQVSEEHLTGAILLCDDYHHYHS